MRRRATVAAALMASSERPGAYWVQLRLPGGSCGLQWEFPGGKVESGETLQAALIRECREELEVELSVGSELWHTDFAYPDFDLSLTLFAATIKSGVPHPHKAVTLWACTPGEMAWLPFCEADKPIVAMLQGGELTGS